MHSLASIWRRHRLSCLSRQELGNYLMGVLDEAAAAYAAFHVEVVGCRFCQANLADLRSRQTEKPEESDTRRQRYFRSSAGYLRRKERG